MKPHPEVSKHMADNARKSHKVQFKGLSKEQKSEKMKIVSHSRKIYRSKLDKGAIPKPNI